MTLIYILTNFVGFSLVKLKKVFKIIGFIFKNQIYLLKVLFIIFVGNLKKQQALRERLNRGIAIDLEDGEFTVKNYAESSSIFYLKFARP
jgi:hypothetical protein